jgi:hypothetical protein
MQAVYLLDFVGPFSLLHGERQDRVCEGSLTMHNPRQPSVVGAEKNDGAKETDKSLLVLCIFES